MKHSVMEVLDTEMVRGFRIGEGVYYLTGENVKSSFQEGFISQYSGDKIRFIWFETLEKCNRISRLDLLY